MVQTEHHKALPNNSLNSIELCIIKSSTCFLTSQLVHYNTIMNMTTADHYVNPTRTLMYCFKTNSSSIPHSPSHMLDNSFTLDALHPDSFTRPRIMPANTIMYFLFAFIYQSLPTRYRKSTNIALFHTHVVAVTY